MPNFSILKSDFQLFIDGIDISKNIESLNLSTGISSVDNPIYLWRGDGVLTHTPESIITLGNDYFNEFANPTRWNKGLQEIVLYIGGFECIHLYIENYRYNSLEKYAEFSLTQNLAIADFDRPGLELDTIIGFNGTSINDLITKLLIEAGKINNSVLFDSGDISISGFEGKMYLPLSTENPVKDASELAVSEYHWLTLNNTGIIINKKRSYEQAPLFQLGASEANFKPNFDSPHKAASKVIVTGSKNVLKAPDKKDKNDVDAVNPVITRTYKKIGEVIQPEFFSAKSGLRIYYSGVDPELPILFEEKTIFYEHYDSGKKIGEVKKTTTTYKRLKGSFLPIDFFKTVNKTIIAYADPLSLVFYREEIEDDEKQEKTVVVPRIVANPDLSWYIQGKQPVTYFPLQKIDVPNLEKVEQGDPKKARKTYVSTSVIDSTGAFLNVGSRPELEPLLPQPKFDTETLIIKGETELDLGYVPLIPEINQVDFNYLESDLVAKQISERIAKQEIGRQKSSYYEISPLVWASNGAKHFFVCDVYDSRVFVDELILEIKEDSISFGFTGELIAYLPVPVPDTLPNPPYIPTGVLQIAPIGMLTGYINSLVINVQLIAIAGVEPYTFSSVDIPSGLSISSTGLLTGTPDTIGSGSFTITVTDDLLNTYDLLVYFDFIGQSIAIPIVTVKSILTSTIISNLANTGSTGISNFIGSTYSNSVVSHGTVNIILLQEYTNILWEIVEDPGGGY